MLIRLDDGITLGGTNGVGGRHLEGVAVGLHGESVVDAREVLGELRGEDLGPDSTGDGVTEGGADVVEGEVDTSHDGKVLMGQVGLERGLGGVREHTTGNTEHDLGTDDTGAAGSVGVTAEPDEETKGNHEKTGTEDDEDLEAPDIVDDESKDETGDDTEEGVEGGNASGGLDAEVEGDNAHGVQVVTLKIPGEVEEAGDAERTPNGAVLHQAEGHKRVGAPELPENEGGDGADTDDEGSNDLSALPLGLGDETTSKSERDEDEGKHGDDEDDTDHVQTPEQVNEELAETKLGVEGLVVVEKASLLGAVANDGEADNKRQRAGGVNDGPHADAPSPSGSFEDGLGDVTAHPRVDNERESGNVGEEETGTSRGDIGNDDFHEEDDHGVADLVDDGATGKGFNVLGRRLDDGADDVEDDRSADELDTAKHVGNLGRGGLGSSSDDGSDDIDGGVEGVLLKVGGSGGLVGVTQRAIETVRVGDEEHAEEDENAIPPGHDGVDGFHAQHTGGLGVLGGLVLAAQDGDGRLLIGVDGAILTGLGREGRRHLGVVGGSHGRW